MSPEKGRHIAAMSRLAGLQMELRRVPVATPDYYEAVNEAVVAFEKWRVSEWDKEAALAPVLPEIGR